MQTVVMEWLRPTLNRISLLNDAIIPFSRRANTPLTVEMWRRAYGEISSILHEGKFSDDHFFDLWYCILEAGLVDCNKMSYTKDAAVAVAEEYETVFDVMTKHPFGQWVSLLFDEIASIVRSREEEPRYVEILRLRYDIPHLVRLLEQAVIKMNVLATCYEHIQQRREGMLNSTMRPTDFSVPAISLLFFEQDSGEDRQYREVVMERITHECVLQLG